MIVVAVRNRVIDGADLLAAAALGGWADGFVSPADANGYVDDLLGWNFKSGTNNPMDDQGHGTHVAGTIAAHGHNGAGVTGVNWAAQVMALKFLGADGSGTSADAIAALNYATEMRQGGVGIGVTNNSYGGDPYSAAFHAALTANREAGMLFVAGAGNGDAFGRAINNDATPFYPAGYSTDDPATTGLNEDNVISVAATDSNDKKAAWSNYGATSVDLAAPGVDVFSLAAGSRDYRYSDGTSMAAPQVAGVAALAWGLSPAAGHAQVRDAVLRGADPKASLDGLVATGARLNARGTISRMGLAVVASTPDGAHDAIGAPTSFTVRFSDPVERTLVLPDALVVGSAPAEQVVVADDGRSAVFSYGASPVLAESAYEMAIVGDSVVRAADGAPLLPWTTEFRYGASAAAAPVLSATASSSTRVDLEWTDATSDEEAFRLERSADGGLTWTTLAPVAAANVTSFSDTAAAAGSDYLYRVSAVAGDRAVGSNVASVATGLAEGMVGPNGRLIGTGLRGDYYDNAGSTGDFTSTVRRKVSYAPTLTRTDATVDFDWAGGSPNAASIGADTFTVRWTGQLVPRHGGDYAFHTEGDDGVRLWVGGKLVIDDWRGHALVENTSAAEVNLEAGQAYPVTLEYFDNTSWAAVRLLWSSDLQAKQVIPSTQLFAANPAAVKVTAGSPAATHLSATRVSAGQINLAWTDNTGDESGFHVERSTDAGKTWSLVATVGANVTAYSNTRLSGGREYAYRVRGYSAAVNSATLADFSNVAAART